MSGPNALYSTWNVALSMRMYPLKISSSAYCISRHSYLQGNKRKSSGPPAPDAEAVKEGIDIKKDKIFSRAVILCCFQMRNVGVDADHQVLFGRFQYSELNLLVELCSPLRSNTILALFLGILALPAALASRVSRDIVLRQYKRR